MRVALYALLCCASAAVMAESIGFDADVIGGAPSGWTCGATGRGSPKWTVEADSSVPCGNRQTRIRSRRDHVV